MAKILIVGCGKVGGLLADALQAKGHEVIGVRRRQLPLSSGLKMIQADIADGGHLGFLPQDADVVFFMVSPDARNAEAYTNVFEQGLANVLARYGNKPLFFISSTSVYGQDAGEWVDEGSPTEPTKITSQIICQAEQRVWAASSDSIVIRFSGIYGTSRNWLLDRVKQSPTLRRSPPIYTNRIHQQDCAGVLVFLLEQKLAGQAVETCYVASDDCPAPEWEVISWLAKQMGCPGPKEESAPIAVGQNKRCSNQRLKNLGYKLVFPDYWSGYREVLGHG